MGFVYQAWCLIIFPLGSKYRWGLVSFISFQSFQNVDSILYLSLPSLNANHSPDSLGGLVL